MNDKKGKNSFDGLMGGVKKMPQDKITPYRPKVEPIPMQRLADDENVMHELLAADDESTSLESGDELTYLRTGYPPKLLKRLRRGEFAIQDELDLHGYFAQEAKPAVHAFINEAAASDVSAIRIVHGKGLHSKHKKPVLKNLILGWLRKNQHVLAVCSTPANDGSTGAIYVLINTR